MFWNLDQCDSKTGQTIFSMMMMIYDDDDDDNMNFEKHF